MKIGRGWGAAPAFEAERSVVHEKRAVAGAKSRAGRGRRGALRALTLAVVASFVALFASVPMTTFAQPDSSDSASAHFTRGVGFYKDSDFTAALVEFKRAYEIEPSYPVLYNIGQTSRELHDYASALTAFEKYLAEGSKAPDQTHLNNHRDKVEGYVAELKPKIGTVTIAVSVEGAEVLVDDLPVGTSPLAHPIHMNAGRRKVSATKSGYVPAQRFVDVAGTDEKTVNLDVVPLGGGAEPGKGNKGGTPPKRKLGPAPFVMLGVTAATGIATAVLGAKALSANGDFQDALGHFPGDKNDIDDKRSTAKTFAIAADVLGGVTIASAATTIVLFATNPGGPVDTSGDDNAHPAKVSLGARVGPTSVEFVGTF